MIESNTTRLRGVVRGVGRVDFFPNTRVSCEHLHITIYLTMGKTDDVCSPNSITITSNTILTS